MWCRSSEFWMVCTRGSRKFRGNLRLTQHSMQDCQDHSFRRLNWVPRAILYGVKSDWRWGTSEISQPQMACEIRAFKFAFWTASLLEVVLTILKRQPQKFLLAVVCKYTTILLCDQKMFGCLGISFQLISWHWMKQVVTTWNKSLLIILLVCKYVLFWEI